MKFDSIISLTGTRVFNLFIAGYNISTNRGLRALLENQGFAKRFNDGYRIVCSIGPFVVTKVK